MTHRHAADWNRRYASTGRLFPVEPDESLVELASGLAPGTALDLGAGEGRNSLWLARQGWRVTAVDLSPVALGRLRAAAGHLPVATVVADMSDYLAGGQSFDLVVLAFIHPAPADRAALLAAAAAAVAPGGHLFLVGHHLGSLGRAGPPDPARLYTTERLRDALPGLRVARLTERRRRPDPGSAPLLDVLAWAERPAAAREPA